MTSAIKIFDAGRLLACCHHKHQLTQKVTGTAAEKQRQSSGKAAEKQRKSNGKAAEKS